MVCVSKIAEKLGNFKKADEIHYDNNGWFLYLFSKKQYENNGSSSEPRFVSWRGCPNKGGSCDGVDGKIDEVRIDRILRELSSDQRERFGTCLQVTNLKPNCEGDKRSFCSKFFKTQYRIRSSGDNTKKIPVTGYPSIIEPCD